MLSAGIRAHRSRARARGSFPIAPCAGAGFPRQQDSGRIFIPPPIHMRGRGERKLARVQVRRGGRPATCCDFVRIAVPQMIGEGALHRFARPAVRRRIRPADALRLARARPTWARAFCNCWICCGASAQANIMSRANRLALRNTKRIRRETPRSMPQCGS